MKKSLRFLSILLIPLIFLSGCGRLALQGGPADLMRPEALLDIYGLPMQVLTREDGGPVAIPA